MAKHNDLTDRALQGYSSKEANPYLWSSASHIAFALGQLFQQTGRTAPRDVRMSRGLSIRANDMLFAWGKDGSFERIN